MTRNTQPGPPPGIFGSAGLDESAVAWLIPVAAAVVTACAGGLWLAGEVSSWAGGAPPPGRPLPYLRALATGRAAWPDAWGWAALALVIALAAATAAGTVHVAEGWRGRRHRADAITRYLAPRADRRRLGPRARAGESARLAPAVPRWTGSPLGRVLPGHQLACSGPEDVS